MNINWKDYITINPEPHQDKPYITGTDISVEIVTDSITDGMSSDEILEKYPQLKIEDIQAAISYAESKKSAEAWRNLIKIREEIRKNWKSKKSAVEILSEMRR